MLVSMSLNYRHAGLGIRERFHLADEDVPRVHARLIQEHATEVVLVRTCNRLEAYCWCPQVGNRSPIDGAEICRPDPDLGRGIARAWVGGDEEATEELVRYARIEHGSGVVRHLLRVASGLESQILGDIHIIGQLRKGYREAVALGSAGSHLHRLFETAFRIGKRVKRETHLMSTRNGVGSEAARVSVAHAIESGVGSVAVVGSGKIGTQAARSLSERGVRDLTILNRTPHRAERLASEIGLASGLGLESLEKVVATSSVIIVATSASSPVLTPATILAGRIAARRLGLPVSRLLVVDVSVPRNVDALVGKMEGVDLIDLDTLHPEAADTEKLRRASVPQAESIASDGESEFLEWLDLESARRALIPLRGLLSEICRREIAYVTGSDANSHRVADRIVARVMANPMIALRAASARGEEIDGTTEVLEALFA